MSPEATPGALDSTRLDLIGDLSDLVVGLLQLVHLILFRDERGGTERSKPGQKGARQLPEAPQRHVGR